MRLFFIGTIEFSKRALVKIVEMPVQVVGVATKAQSSFHTDFADLSPLCESSGIPCRFVDNINDDEVVAWIKSLRPDVIFCLGWSSLFKKEMFAAAPMGVIGYHPAALPQNRGRHPIIWPLVLGLEETASTFFFMDQGVDSGDILSQEFVTIDYSDDAGNLYEKLINTALKQIKEFIPLLAEGTFKRIPQDHSKANVWRKRTKDDGKIDFRMPSRAIYNLVRALAKPYAGAHVVYKKQDYKVWKCRVILNDSLNLEPGKVLSIDEGIIRVKTIDGVVELIDHGFDDLPVEGDYLS